MRQQMSFVLAAAGIAEMDPDEAGHIFDPIVVIGILCMSTLFMASLSAAWLFGYRTVRAMSRPTRHPLLSSAPHLVCTTLFLLFASGFAVGICISGLFLARIL
jgi:hypothetical protein